MLRPDEYVAGVRILRRKIRRWKPKIVAFVGVSLYRAAFARRGPIALGVQSETYEGARHGWMISGGKVYHAEQAQRGFAKLMGLLDGALGP